MKAIFSTCLLFGLLSPEQLGFSAAAPLTCYSCMGEGCGTPETQVCADDQDACFVSLTEVKLGSALLPSYHVLNKNCGTTQGCLDNIFSMSVDDGGSYRSNLKCCYTNLCNNMSISLPEPAKLPPNEKKCPACFSLSSAGCMAEENITCTGDEMKCIEGAIEVSTDLLEEVMHISFQGCATPNMCYIPLSKTHVSSHELKFSINQLQCTKGYEDSIDRRVPIPPDF